MIPASVLESCVKPNGVTSLWLFLIVYSGVEPQMDLDRLVKLEVACHYLFYQRIFHTLIFVQKTYYIPVLFLLFLTFLIHYLLYPIFTCYLTHGELLAGASISFLCLQIPSPCTSSIYNHVMSLIAGIVPPFCCFD